MFEKDKLYTSGPVILAYAGSKNDYNEIFEILEDIGKDGSEWGLDLDVNGGLFPHIIDYKPLLTNRYWSLHRDVREYEPQETSGPIYEQYIRLKRLVVGRDNMIIPTKLKTKFIMGT